MPTAREIATHLDELLATSTTPDYSPALNGLQMDSRGPVHRVAAAVDLSRRTIEGAVAAGANLLVVHHGMFWGGAQRLVGAPYERLRLLVEHDVAVYSSHIPLDRHPEVGNNVLLARELGLEPAGGFGEYKGITIGVRGESELPTSELVRRADEFARRHGGLAMATAHEPGRTTRRWAVVTGGGASPETIREAVAAGVDTLVVGEGPHHTAVDAPEQGLVIVYAGHYATETPGVQALARHIEERWGLPWSFVEAPTGL
ncbi:MAG TPA: Nif3-like dinuclear metal center hexameric protein [Gemmatimonadales bacterium]